MTIREYLSIIVDRYAQPAFVRIYVISVVQTVLGELMMASLALLTIAGELSEESFERFGLNRFCVVAAAIPNSFIYRETVDWAICMPSPWSSKVILGAPRNGSEACSDRILMHMENFFSFILPLLA